MAQVSASIDLPAPFQQVWDLVGGFGSLPDWHPLVAGSELSEGGRVRRLTTSDGQSIVERLLVFDEAAHSYSYTFIGEPLPMTGYRATLSVRAADGGQRAHVDWRGEFVPKGASEAEASRLLQGIYEAGLKALARRFGAEA